jgi:Flp pilus assembly protein TadD
MSAGTDGIAAARRLTLIGVAMAALMLGGCLRHGGDADITGSISRQTVTMTEAEKRLAAEELGRRYEAKRGDKATSLQYARLLRETGQVPQAIAVMQTTTLANPNDRDIALALGQALADGGRYQEAQEVLARAHSADRPSWRVLSTQGAIADQMGQHQRAQEYYDTALKIAPGEPAILSNMSLSYALSNRLQEAEQIGRQVVAHPAATPRMRGNLALVLALQGRFQEAEQVAQKDLSPADAAANIAFVRSMTAQRNSWQQLKAQEGQKPRQPQAAQPRT